MFKSFQTTEKTKVIPTLRTNSLHTNTSSQIFETKHCNLKVTTPPKKICPQPTCSANQKLASSIMSPEQWKKYRKELNRGKTYRKTKYDPSIVSMQDPEVRQKLDNIHRRDTKSGGLSSSSRIRRDPNRIRLVLSFILEILTKLSIYQCFYFNHLS